MDIREYDVPYHVRVAIDVRINVGHWYYVRGRGSEPPEIRLVPDDDQPDRPVSDCDNSVVIMKSHVRIIIHNCSFSRLCEAYFSGVHCIVPVLPIRMVCFYDLATCIQIHTCTIYVLYMYVHVHLHVYVCVYMHNIRTCTHIHIHVDVHVQTYTYYNMYALAYLQILFTRM